VVDRDELAWLIDELAFSAKQVEEAGIDGVELHANNDDLLQWFLSPRTNVRTDGYGGNVANRARLLLEIIDGIRAVVGARFAVGVRLVVDEMIEGGYTNDEAIEIARLLDDHGIDFLHGVVGNPWGTPTYITPPTFPPGAFAGLVGRVKAEVSVPVVYTGRVTSPAVAERILADGQADVIGVARALIADPEFVRKAREGRDDEIRPCIGCNECIARVLVDRIPFTCSVNPHAGREAWLRPASNGGAPQRRLLVVGGGPAGMELAASAAEHGFAVTLWERDLELGGQLRAASRAPGLEDFARYVAHQSRRLGRLGVTVELGREATVDEVRAQRPDVVGVATGARPRRPMATGLDQPHVHELRDVLLGRAEVSGEQVVVVAEDDHVAPLAVAEVLALAGHRVHVVYPTNGPAPSLSRHTLGPALARLSAAGVTWTFMERVVAIDEGLVHTRNVYSGLPGATVPAEAVVLACGSEAEAELAEGLRAELGAGGPAVHVLGDAYAPRRISFATRQATALVASLVS
jgi:NADPH-dependent 2,4-dienoyl-CoA reductase/sulfur reductase-like enzyme